MGKTVRVEFVEDDPEGGAIVECWNCGAVFPDRGKISCPACKRDLRYPMKDKVKVMENKGA